MFSKSQVDRAGESLRNDASDVEALRVLDWWRGQHADAHRRALAELQTLADVLGLDEARASARLKKSDQIIRKLRSSQMRLSTMDDIAGGRLVLPSLTDFDTAVPRIGQRLDVRSVKDMVAAPTPLGYRAVHLLCRVDEVRVEVQVRTRHQHAWAQMVEVHDGETGDDAKHGRAPGHILAAIRGLADSMAKMGAQGFEEGSL